MLAVSPIKSLTILLSLVCLFGVINMKPNTTLWHYLKPTIMSYLYSDPTFKEVKFIANRIEPIESVKTTQDIRENLEEFRIEVEKFAEENKDTEETDNLTRLFREKYGKLITVDRMLKTIRWLTILSNDPVNEDDCKIDALTPLFAASQTLYHGLAKLNRNDQHPAFFNPKLKIDDQFKFHEFLKVNTRRHVGECLHLLGARYTNKRYEANWDMVKKVRDLYGDLNDTDMYARMSNMERFDKGLMGYMVKFRLNDVKDYDRYCKVIRTDIENIVGYYNMARAIFEEDEVKQFYNPGYDFLTLNELYRLCVIHITEYSL